MKFWHWAVIVVVVFVVCNVYNAGTLSGVPIVGKYVSS
jgi:hypothetical protein